MNYIIQFKEEMKDCVKEELHFIYKRQYSAYTICHEENHFLHIQSEEGYIEHYQTPIFIENITAYTHAIQSNEVVPNNPVRVLLQTYQPKIACETVKFHITSHAKAYPVRSILEEVLSYTSDQHMNEDRTSKYVFSVFAYDAYVFCNLCLETELLTPWKNGIPFFSISKEMFISRAEHKIEEAVRYFTHRQTFQPKEVTYVLDIGAAPGGWTSYFLKQNKWVIAVDPAKLDDRIREHKHVEYYGMTIDEFLRVEDIDTIDLVVNDMKMDGIKAAEVLNSLSEDLAADTYIISTMKLPKYTDAYFRYITQLRNILKQKYDVCDVRHLHYNRHEVTFLLKNR